MKTRNLTLCLAGLLSLFICSTEAHAATVDSTLFTFQQQFAFDVFSLKACYLNNDAYTDLVIATGNGPDTGAGVYVAFGNASGTFDTPAKVNLAKAASLAVNYVNDDTLLDIIIVASAYNPSGATWTVLLNNGNGTFTPHVFPTLYILDNVTYVVTGYFNNDAHLDVIYFAFAGTGSEQSVINFGDGTGDFPTYTTLPFCVDGAAVGDFNEDGIDDIACKPYSDLKDSVAIYLNDGNGNLTRSGQAYAPGGSPRMSTANGLADFNEDGHLDFVLVGFVDPPKSFLTIGFGDGNGGITSVDTIRVIGYHWYVEALDLNHDNHMDIVSSGASNAGGYGPHLEIFYGDGSGSFSNAIIAPHPSSIAAFAMSPADLDLDGNTDFVVGAYSFGLQPITLLYNTQSELSTGGNAISFSASTESSSRAAIGNIQAAQMEIKSPSGDRFSRNKRSLATASYARLDLDRNATLDEQLVEHAAQAGQYAVVVHPNATALSGTPFSLRVRRANGPGAVLALNYNGFSGKTANDSMLLTYSTSNSSPVSPQNGLASGTTQPMFLWPMGMHATAFQFQLDRYHDFRAPIYDVNNLAQSHFATPAPLNQESVYYWHYRSFVNGQWTDYSPTYAAYISTCCVGIRGNVDGSALQNPTISDLVYLVSFLFNSGSIPPCEAEADVNASGNITIGDLTRLVSFLFAGGSSLAACPED